MTRLLNRLRRRHTAAVAYLALFLALGGSAYAAATIRGTDVYDRSLGGIDIAYDTVDGYNIKDGSVGPNNLTFGLVTTRVENTSATARASTKSVEALCPLGSQATGGGAQVVDASGDYVKPENLVSLTGSWPTSGGRGWSARAEVVDFPAIPEGTLHYNDDNVVDGWASYISEDRHTYREPWGVKAWAICTKFG